MLPSPTFPPCGEESKGILKTSKCVGAYGALEDTGYDSFLVKEEFDDDSNSVFDANENLLEKSTTKPPQDPPTPPNGGWGWVVVAASFFCLCVLDGISYTFGMFLAPLMEDMECGRGGVSAAGSFQVFVFLTIWFISLTMP